MHSIRNEAFNDVSCLAFEIITISLFPNTVFEPSRWLGLQIAMNTMGLTPLKPASNQAAIPFLFAAFVEYEYSLFELIESCVCSCTVSFLLTKPALVCAHTRRLQSRCNLPDSPTACASSA